MKYLVDTCGWIEWLTKGELAHHFEEYLKSPTKLLVPTILQFEVFRWVSREKDVAFALDVIGIMEQGEVVPLDTLLAIRAAEIAKEKKLAMADAIIYTTAQLHQSILVTSDKHFANLANVKYFGKTHN